MPLPSIETAAGLAYRDAGRGVPLLLLHAFPLSGEMWAPQFDALADAARLIAPDAPGLGASPARADGWTIDGHADEIVGLLDALSISEPAVVLGLSLGGYVALALARRHPGRVRALVLADTKAEADTDEAKANRDRLMATARERGAAAVLDAMLPKMLSARTREQSPEVEREVRRIGGDQSAEGVALALGALRDRPDATPGLADIACPTSVIVGSSDEITPPAVARKLTEAIRDARQVEILGAGHLSSLEKPAEFGAAVRAFLAALQNCPPDCEREMFSAAG